MISMWAMVCLFCFVLINMSILSDDFTRKKCANLFFFHFKLLWYFAVIDKIYLYIYGAIVRIDTMQQRRKRYIYRLIAENCFSHNLCCKCWPPKIINCSLVHFIYLGRCVQTVLCFIGVCYPWCSDFSVIQRFEITKCLSHSIAHEQRSYWKEQTLCKIPSDCLFYSIWFCLYVNCKMIDDR